MERQKGKSLLNFPKDYCVVDLETTGLDPEFNEIIEMAAIRVRNEQIVDTFSVLVKPPYETLSVIIQNGFICLMKTL